jgi:hypothetical protein
MTTERDPAVHQIVHARSIGMMSGEGEQAYREVGLADPSNTVEAF